MDTQTILARWNMMPEYLRAEAIDYIDFLLEKHGIGKKEDELTNEQKQLLDERLKAYKQNPDDGLTLEAYRAKVKAKYGK